MTPSQMISHDELCELATITDNAEKENLTDTGKVIVAVSPFLNHDPSVLASEIF